jgi:DNA-binding NarL/FixJ family response regulator
MEGETAKDIAPVLNLSQRTIEHRIDKMKVRYEARNVVHLTAKLFAIHMDRRMREDRTVAGGDAEG